MSLLGGALVRQAADPSLALEARMEKLREAEPLLVESGEWLTQNADRIPQQYRAELLRQALERVVKLYESWHAAEPDAGHDTRAAELMSQVVLFESASDPAKPQKGRPRVYVVLGDEHVESAEAIGDVRVQVERDGPEPRVIVSSERTGEVCPYDLTVRTATGSATIRGAIVNAEWKVQVFAYETDPREDVDAWHREGADHVLFRLNSLYLPYGQGGPSQLVQFDPRVTDAEIPSNHFGTIATTEVTIPAGRWEIRTVSDDGVRVWVDGELLIDNWTWHGPTVDTAELTFDEPRSVEVRVEHFELDGWAELSFDLRPLPSDADSTGKAPDPSDGAARGRPPGLAALQRDEPAGRSAR
jgi:hypothetical protein